MYLQVNDPLIPGTVLKRDDMGGLTGMAFLKQIFFISNGVMLTQIRDISGIDGSTLQNWTKRGWVANSKLKKYDIDQVAHILIINMLRSCMQLDKIAFLIGYINGDLEDTEDDIISDSKLYDYICRTLDGLMGQNLCSMTTVHETIREVTGDYTEPVAGARERLTGALEVIIVAYYASLIKRNSDELLGSIETVTEAADRKE